jgi:hypothetical protein
MAEEKKEKQKFNHNGKFDTAPLFRAPLLRKRDISQFFRWSNFNNLVPKIFPDETLKELGLKPMRGDMRKEFNVIESKIIRDHLVKYYGQPSTDNTGL